MIHHKLAIAISMVVLALLVACGGAEQTLPTATPEAETTFVPELEPAIRSFMLRLDAPDVNLVTDSDQVSVSGVAFPDAVVSVNGRLALPNAEGRFSITLDRPQTGGPMDRNPFAIEVVATSITGESESRVRPVIFANDSGVFGEVSKVASSEITILTGAGPITLAIDAATAVRIHGWESPSASDIALGTLAAVLTDGSRAVSILAVPGRPVHTRHFTGLVVGSVSTGSENSDIGKTLTLRDDSGRQITATIMDGLEPAPMGELVTAVLEQDLSTGSLTFTAFDRAIAGAQRLNEALALAQDTGATESFANINTLRWRLVEHGVRNISMLVNGDRQTAAEAAELYAGLFSKHNIGAPSADVTGLVTAIDSGAGQVTVQPDSGPAVMVKLSDATQVALFGERVRSGQLDLASRVIVRYGLAGGDASHLTILAGNTLPDDASRQLALSAGRGEVQGTLMDVGPDSVIINVLDRATGQRISLRTAGAADLGSLGEGAIVFARFNPDSHRLLELESAALLSGEELVSGVVHSFVPKIVAGNLTIRTPDGQLRSFTHHPETLIRRDGLNVSINEVRLGDLVRPNTRVLPPDTPGGRAGEIVVLSLKAPEPGLVTGFVRGVSAGAEGEVLVTVSDIWLELIKIRIGPNTVIVQEGRLLTLQDLAVGQKLNQGFFDPVTLVAGQLKLAPAKPSVRASLGR